MMGRPLFSTYHSEVHYATVLAVKPVKMLYHSLYKAGLALRFDFHT